LRRRRAELREIEVSSETGLTDLKRMLQVVLRGEAEADQAKKEMVEANLRLVRFPSRRNIRTAGCNSWT